MTKRRILPMILSLILAMLVTMPTSAIDGSRVAEIGHEETQSIKAGYTETFVESSAVYKVDITWGSMDFTYSLGGKQLWNPEKMLFELVDPAPQWVCEQGADAVKVVNHSNAEVAVKITYTKAENGISGSLTNGNFVLKTADNGKNGEAGTPTESTATLILSKTLPDSFTVGTSDLPIGQLTVSIIGSPYKYEYDTATNTYTVYNEYDLLLWNEVARAAVSSSWGYGDPNLILGADIDMTDAGGWLPVGGYIGDNFYPYCGNVDGGNHTITGFQIDCTKETGGHAFIGSLEEGYTVKDLNFKDVNVTGALMYSGIVVAENYGTIENCHVRSGSLTAVSSCVGGIAGCNNNPCMILGCTNAATVVSEEGMVGGIVGYNTGFMNGCYNTGNVSGSRDVGGIAGTNILGCYIIACGNTGAVSADSRSGGIVGNSWGSNSYSASIMLGSWTVDTDERDDEAEVIEGKDGVGYIEGDTTYSIITACYSFASTADATETVLTAMNDAITEYNSTVDENTDDIVTCPYRWQAVTDGYPVLVIPTA